MNIETDGIIVLNLSNNSEQSDIKDKLESIIAKFKLLYIHQPFTYRYTHIDIYIFIDYSVYTEDVALLIDLSQFKSIYYIQCYDVEDKIKLKASKECRIDSWNTED